MSSQLETVLQAIKTDKDTNLISANCTIYVKDSATQTLLTSWDNTHTYTIK